MPSTPLLDHDHTGYNKNALDGPLKKLPQTGSSWYDDKTAGWRVSPFWPVKMPYLVIDKSKTALDNDCLLYTSPSPRDRQKSRMPSSA